MQIVGLLAEDCGRSSGFLRQVHDGELPILQALLDQHSSDDPYQLSAGYYALTGRDGLWLVQEDHAAVIVCRHPNLVDELLVFPPIGIGGMDLLARTIVQVATPSLAVTLARSSESVVERLAVIQPSYGTRRIGEAVLDWAYPLHILDPDKISVSRGKGFQQLRTELKKVDLARVRAVDLCPSSHHMAVNQIVARWSRNNGHLAAPYERLLGLFGKVPFAGRLVLYDEVPAGFSIWDEALKHRGIANAYAHIGLREIAGMARYVLFDMCRILCGRGFREVCVGGSETAGLDQFKRQLRPIRSARLESWQIRTPGFVAPALIQAG